MAYTGEPDSSTVWTDAILNFEMAALHSDLNTEARESQNAGSADWRFAGKNCLR